MTFMIERFELLLLLAALVAMLARRLHLPYSVGLVLAGIGVAVVRLTPPLTLTKDLLFTTLLPPLVFEAAFYIRWQELRRDLALILTLATVGVVLSAGCTAIGMYYLAHWEWASAVVFGVLIAATDPVSVIATFKEAGVHGRLRLLVEAESLLNDGTAAVALSVAVLGATGGGITAGAVVQTVGLTVLGGLLCGAGVAGVVLLLAGQTEDHLVEITLTTVAAYGSFLLAEHFHLSGVLASLTAGLLVGNLGSFGSLSERGREAVESFWDYAAFVANSLIFLLIGVHEAQQSFTGMVGVALGAIGLVTLGRAVAIYPCVAVFARSRWRVPRPHQHILFWGGLRGALALALALGLPPAMPQRDAIVTLAFAVVAFSIFVQGLTMTPLLRQLGALPPGEARET